MQWRLTALGASLFLAHASLADEKTAFESARAFAAPLVATTCRLDGPTDNRLYPLRYRLPGQDQDSPDFRMDLIQIDCAPDPVNRGSVFVARDPASGAMTLLSFAEPRLDYDYEDESFSQLKGPPRILGYATVPILYNARFEPADLKITANRKWRATADAWSRGTWSFRDGSFVLIRYETDPTFDKVQPDASQSKPESYIIFQSDDQK